MIGQTNDASCLGYATLVNWYDANTYCSTLTLANKTWRLPDINELLDLTDIVDYNMANPAFFPNAVYLNASNQPDGARYYWSSNDAFNDQSQSLVLYELNSIFNMPKSQAPNNYNNQFTVRCVSGPKSSEKLFFVDNTDGTAKDKKTGLLWQKAETYKNNFTAVLNYCSTLNLAEKTWRVPNINELRSTIDFSKLPDSSNNPNFTRSGRDGVYSSTQVYDRSDPRYSIIGRNNYIYSYPNSGDHSYYFRCVSGP